MRLFVLSALLRKRDNIQASFKTCLGYRRKDDKDAAVGSFVEYLQTFDGYDIVDLLCMEIPNDEVPKAMDTKKFEGSESPVISLHDWKEGRRDS